MATVDLSSDDFEQTVLGNEIVVIDFWAPWCGPCRSFAPIYDAASDRHPGIVFAKVNTEEQQELAEACEIRSIPTLMIFRERILLFAQPGALAPNDFDAVLEEVKGLDMDDVRRQLAEGEVEDDEEVGPDDED